MDLDIPVNDTGENKKLWWMRNMLIHSEEQPMKQLEPHCIFNLPPFLCTTGQIEVQKLKIRG